LATTVAAAGAHRIAHPAKRKRVTAEIRLNRLQHPQLQETGICRFFCFNLPSKRLKPGQISCKRTMLRAEQEIGRMWPASIDSNLCRTLSEAGGQVGGLAALHGQAFQRPLIVGA
jgi:hypothetical protein